VSKNAYLDTIYVYGLVIACSLMHVRLSGLFRYSLVEKAHVVGLCLRDVSERY